MSLKLTRYVLEGVTLERDKYRMTEARTSKATPGPWEVSTHLGITNPLYVGVIANLGLNDADNMVAVVTSLDHVVTIGECEANANLIAAAPDLLMALEVTRQIMESDSKVHIGSSWWAMVNNAILKARGGTA